MTIVLITAIFAVALAMALGLALGFFREFFKVEQDPLVGKVRYALPGANCGACGIGLRRYAAASRAAPRGYPVFVGGKGTAAAWRPHGVKASAEDVWRSSLARAPSSTPRSRASISRTDLPGRQAVGRR
jgi:hypothetical protein